MDPSGNWIVADIDNARIRRIDTSGTITTIVGTAPDGVLATTAQLHPWSIAISRTGDLYMGELSTCAIRKVDSAGLLSTVPRTGNCAMAPVSIAVDSHGTVYSSTGTTSQPSKVNVISSSGSNSAVNGLLGGPLAIDSQDRLYAVDDGRILSIAHGGTVQTTIVGGPNLAIALDSNDNLYIAENPTPLLAPDVLYRLNENSSLTSLAGFYPDDVSSFAIDQRGDFWMIDYAGRLSAMGPRLSYQEFYSPVTADGPLLSARIGGVSGAQVGPDGSIYVIDAVGKCVRKISGAPPQVEPVIFERRCCECRKSDGGSDRAWRVGLDLRRFLNQLIDSCPAQARVALSRCVLTFSLCAHGVSLLTASAAYRRRPI
jgi:streptogramin lyase